MIPSCRSRIGMLVPLLILYIIVLFHGVISIDNEIKHGVDSRYDPPSLTKLKTSLKDNTPHVSSTVNSQHTSHTKLKTTSTSTIHRQLQSEQPSLIDSSLIRPIRFAFAVDDHTYRDVIILINSIIESAYEPKKFAFHIVACGQDELSSNRLKNLILEKIESCYPDFVLEQRDDQKMVYTTTKTVHEANPKQNTFTYEVLSFHLPENSGFELQLLRSLPQHLAELRNSNRASSGGSGGGGGAGGGPGGGGSHHGGAHHGHNKAHGGSTGGANTASSTSNGGTGSGKLNHWNSLSGADMTRFYLPSLFPYATKLLYLDNDIIVNCCIEEIFDTHLPPGKVIGLALDDLHWAVSTQFQWHYNASHPLVIQSLSRGDVMLSRYPQLSVSKGKKNKKHLQKAVEEEPLPEVLDPKKPIKEISTENFMKLVPKYPNDGVMLFNVSAYNQMNVLQEMDAIAYANGMGEFVVNMGTQQFTVLAMFDRWEELTPRANLRHFPDMARGYLMWFTYNGIVHYAGQSKPKVLCAVDSFKDNNWLRVQSYTGWLLNHYWLYDKCSNKQDMFYEHCLQPKTGPLALSTTDTKTINIANSSLLHHHHIVHPKTLPELYHWMKEILKANIDMNYIYVKIGISPKKDDLFHELDEKFYKELDGISSNSSSNLASGNVLKVLEHVIFYQSLWSIRVYDQEVYSKHSSTLLKRMEHLRESSLKYHTNLPPPTLPPSEPAPQGHGKKKGGKKNNSGPPVPPPNVPNKRVLKYLHHLPVCEMKADEYMPLPLDYPKTYARNFTEDANYYVQVPCISILNNVKEDKKGHWDVNAISIFKSTTKETLQAMYALDMIFMRPKIILICIRSQVTNDMKGTIAEIQRFLRRVGYIGEYHEDQVSNVVYVWGVRTNLLEYK